jgi:hypothetical protein
MHIELNTPQSRAILAGLAAGAGIEAGDDPRVTVVMLILFAIGGLVDRIVERRQARRKGAKP